MSATYVCVTVLAFALHVLANIRLPLLHPGTGRRNPFTRNPVLKREFLKSAARVFILKSGFLNQCFSANLIRRRPVLTRNIFHTMSVHVRTIWVYCPYYVGAFSILFRRMFNNISVYFLKIWLCGPMHACQTADPLGSTGV